MARAFFCFLDIEKARSGTARAASSLKVRHSSIFERAFFMKSSPAAPNAAKIPFSHRHAGAALTLLAVAIGGFGAVRWANLLGSQPQAMAETSDTRAWALLGRALRANSDVPFAAHVETVVFVGERSLQSEARIVKAPGHLSISYLSGPMKGQSSGFSRQIFWRQGASGQLSPYAQTAMPAAQIASRRFELMRANYRAQRRKPAAIDGRPVEVVELRPANATNDFGGPARRVFIDAATGLTLRIEEFNARLQPASHSTFSRLDLHPAISQDTFRAPSALLNLGVRDFWRGEELGDDARAVQQKTGLVPPQSASVPRGWKRDGFGVHRCTQTSEALQVAAFTRYTDGLNVLMLFAMKSAPGAALTDTRQKPMSCSFGPGALVSRTDGAGTLLALGDLPPDILRKVLKDARFKEVAPIAATPTTSPTTISPVQKPKRRESPNFQ